MSTVRTSAKNTLMIATSSIANKLLSFVFLIYVVRYLGSIGFGKYSFVFAFITFFTVFSAFGMDGLTIREVAKDKSRANSFLINTSVSKLLIILLSWVIIIYLLIILNKDIKTNLGVLIISLCLLPDSIVRSFKAIFSGYEKMEYNTLIEILFRVIVVGLGLGVIFFDYGLVPIFLVSLIASILTFIFATYIYTVKIGKIKLKIDFHMCKHLLQTSFPFFLAGVFVSIYNRIDTVMLSVMKGDAPVGWYNAAHGLTDSLLFIPAAIYGAIFPVFSRMYKDSRESFNTAYEKSFKFLLLLALPIAVGTTILADKIIILIFKLEFSNSIIALRILVWTIAIAFLNIVMASALYSANRQKIITGITFFMAFLNIVLNYLVIPKYSYVGASWTTVVTQFVGVICCYYFVTKYIYKINLSNIFPKPILAVLLMGLFVYQFRNLNLFIIILAGALLYFLTLILLKTFTADDKTLIKQLVFSRK